MVAEDETGASYSYGAEGFPRGVPDIPARVWLGVSPKPGD